jgi:hypothetical protein
MNAHITPGYNGWTSNAGQIARTIKHKAEAARYAEKAEQREELRKIAELEYYEENHCYPQPLGYFGAETDVHFYER